MRSNGRAFKTEMLTSGDRRSEVSHPSPGFRRCSPESFWNWRRGELNPCPDRSLRELLHVYPMRIFKGPDVASAHRRPPSVHEILHRPTRSLRRTISLLSMSPAVAGVQPVTSRSIKPRERDLGDLRLFVLVRILTRPTNHPRHAACASNHQSKPVRPRFFGKGQSTGCTPDLQSV